MTDIKSDVKNTICKDIFNKNGIQYLIMGVSVLVILYILYKAGYCFYKKQSDCDSFISKTIKTGTDSDKSFDVEIEVNELIKKQESYLHKLNANRNF